MNVFDLRRRLIEDYSSYIESFLNIQDERIRQHVEQELEAGRLWPQPLIQLNPSFEPGKTVEALVQEDVLHRECGKIFRKGKEKAAGSTLRLHKHQEDAVRIARTGANYVLTTGTGSGKSLAYIIPVVDHVLRSGSGRGIQAIIVYPMNALANSQEGELKKFLELGYSAGKSPVTFARYTGQEGREERDQITQRPPDILLTNYVMLELILTRPYERKLIEAAKGLRFLVLDELHTYRGRQGADVAMLIRRAREAFSAERLQCVGTSATLSSGGTFTDQQREVGRVATLLFGGEVEPTSVIGETLRRSTPDRPTGDPAFLADLRARTTTKALPPQGYKDFVEHPLSIWIESELGLGRETGSDRLIRREPRSIEGEDGASAILARHTGIKREDAAEAIQRHLLASYEAEPNPETGFPIFAFRLHQFISRGDNVYSTMEDPSHRHITIQGQVFAPGSNQTRRLLPLAFCRECGQEYYVVWMEQSPDGSGRAVRGRELSERQSDEDAEAGFLYGSPTNPWPSDPQEVLKRVPEDWIETGRNGVARVESSKRDYLPRAFRIGPDGKESSTGQDVHFVPSPFRFCLECEVAYDSKQRSDFAALAPLGMEGRSTATTILSLATVRYLRATETEQARKLLSFTDNRQDASLQAGHFNDFVELGLLRSALHRAAVAAGTGGISHDELVQKAFEALALPTEVYAADPDVRFQAKADTDRALRNVLGYRLYRDLRRGWRIASPNLEQCGLLELQYPALPDICSAEDLWEKGHPILRDAKPKNRETICRALLDLMRRELAIKVDFLDREFQERIVHQSTQLLREPWNLDEQEQREYAQIVLPRPRRGDDSRTFLFLAARGAFGQYLRRNTTFPDAAHDLPAKETDQVIRELLEALRVGGLVQIVLQARDKDDAPGYQLAAAGMRWVAGAGDKPYHDVLRKPRASKVGARTNEFFKEYYRTIAGDGATLRAREHTAAVRDEDRQRREQDFRSGKLPVLYCSPTMELGIDIAELNVVNMRNVPPTPANYAQRSGRAGRSGQPALVFTYCSTFQSHDQYFFRRPELMVAGVVAPPRIDLANEDLIRAHVQALWLGESKADLRNSLSELLDTKGDKPSLDIVPSMRADLENEAPRQRARQRAERILGRIQAELDASDWYTSHWLQEVFDQLPLRFDRACDRWRNLYRAAAGLRDQQHKIATDNSRPAPERERARGLRKEAETQIELLLQSSETSQADFYSYRYFASEGFLPGYSFPRLPLSAYIPGRRGMKGRNEYISRPRFLAISEFGPRAILYHEGSRYRITRVVLPLDETGEGKGVITRAAKQCQACGYLHPTQNGSNGPDKCERCQVSLGAPLHSLFRLQNVSTRRADRINSDEEERQRLGYEIRTAIRFEDSGNRVAYRMARILRDGELLATLTYGHAALLWRINLGWKRRKEKHVHGFLLDVEKGVWERSQEDDDQSSDDPTANPTHRVVPFVEDRRNALLFEPASLRSDVEMASLQAALKRALQAHFQLEESELAAEPLPSTEDGERKLLLFYEAAEGGAGALRRLLDDPDALAQVARKALDTCHFDSDTGHDRARAPRAKEACEAACYDCLMSYQNQREHELLNRHAIKDLLLALTRSCVESSPGPKPRAEHLAELKKLAGSDLERKFLDFLEQNELRLPDKGQSYIDDCRVKPDFLYESPLQTVVYVDGPVHDFPDRAERDRTQQNALEDLGYTVLRFEHDGIWPTVVREHPNVFGELP